MVKKFSPNYESRGGIKPIFIVIHIAEGNKESVIAEFASPKTEKSSHYLINRDGSIIQFVDEAQSAWTNGIVWNPRNELVKEKYLKGISINKCSITIEAEGFASQEPTEAYYKTCAQLVKEISQRWNIPLDANHVIPHNSIRRDKTCPGKISAGKILSLLRETPQPHFQPPPAQPSLPAWYLQFLERFKNKLGFSRTLGVARSNDWPKFRKIHIKKNCECCDRKATILKPLQLHHKKPFHIYPELECDLNNVITLCGDCHLLIGHLMNFKSFNESVREDAALLKSRIDKRPVS